MELKPIYLDALYGEIRHFYDNNKQKTIYIGGGTPSILSIGDFEEILSLFSFEDNAEITVEVNPESVNLDYLKGLKNAGVNRLSIGVQSFKNSILNEIGRLHTSEKAIDTIIDAKKAGFENVSIDLMYGLPNQSLQDFEDDLNKAITFDIEHISLYGLKIDKGCYFYKNLPQNIANDDVQADMYLKALDVLGTKFKRYEISNFAKSEKFEGKHNLNYWEASMYYGFGVSASGFFSEGRYTNPRSIEQYIKNPTAEKQFEKTNLHEEKIFLGLRTEKGINICSLNEQFNIDFEKKYGNILKKFDNFFEKTNQGYKLKTEGLLVSNVILSEFLEDC